MIYPSVFRGLGALSDMTLNEEFLASREIDLFSSDDTQFNVASVYCSSHMRIHSTGWCTVPNSLKLPNDHTLPAEYRV